jgi:hypothetical protein
MRYGILPRVTKDVSITNGKDFITHGAVEEWVRVKKTEKMSEPEFSEFAGLPDSYKSPSTNSLPNVRLYLFLRIWEFPELFNIISAYPEKT